ncbi:hypothetical protein OG785_45465 [Streptomyces sp. NBC_00006]|uniref:hypothetical protein n=1 Tax=Streptomyces sp. NBC_00006 TaxID=2975619 RepID=UPI00225692C6|nr:hypothetical protein [Streptomyces sp. NBC_00006]MCX5528959.1 hypothetical protein [Streptomyces sp. NBC_00006]MCX5537809.1 hypothetical protein [Streptomyces sp. NBC_00006]
MGRKFRDMETAEQAYARQAGPARAEAARSEAVSHRRSADHERQQMTTAAFETPEQRQMGIAKIRRAPDADRRSRKARRHEEQAEAAEQRARDAEGDAKPKKRGWFF